MGIKARDRVQMPSGCCEMKRGGVLAFYFSWKIRIKAKIYQKFAEVGVVGERGKMKETAARVGRRNKKVRVRVRQKLSRGRFKEIQHEGGP